MLKLILYDVSYIDRTDKQMAERTTDIVRDVPLCVKTYIRGCRLRRNTTCWNPLNAVEITCCLCQNQTKYSIHPALQNGPAMFNRNFNVSAEKSTH